MPWYRHFLWPLAILFGMGVAIRNFLFDIGVLQSRQFDVPVICVGNLEVGGTGKSPLVSFLVKMLLNAGKNVAVISRGYGRKTKGFYLVDVDSNAVEMGDEPLQLKLKFSDAAVAVCEDRVVGIGKLLELHPKPDFVIMDDGFQHRWVKPTLSILTTNAQFPFFENFLLPVGTLREPANSRDRADVIVFTNSSQEVDATKYKGTANAFHSSIVGKKLVMLRGDEKGHDNEPLSSGSVLLFSGIANAHRFKSEAEKHHDVIGHIVFKDHHSYTVEDVRLLRKKIDSFGAACKAVITTEKDAARLKGSPFLQEFGSIPVYYLPVELEFLSDTEKEFEKLILSYGKHA